MCVCGGGGAATPTPTQKKQRILHIRKVDSLSSIARVEGGCLPGGGLQEAKHPALHNIKTDSIYIIHILPHNFPGTFHNFDILG